MTYLEYLKYIEFACDEELERLSEFLYCVENKVDQTGDKYYVAYPSSNCPPDLDHVVAVCVGRDMKADFAIIDEADSSAMDAREDLYSELRGLFLYS